MYTCIYVYMYVYMHSCIYVYMYIYIYVKMYVFYMYIFNRSPAEPSRGEVAVPSGLPRGDID